MVFLGFYLVSSIIANDFYKIPISAAFLLASIYGIIICKGLSIEQRINIFSEGAGNKNVLLIPYVLVITLAIKGVNVTAVLTIGLVVNALTRQIRGKRGAELSIAALVSLANLCTANNTIAIITVGGIARDISKRFNIDPRKSSSILDTFSCLIGTHTIWRTASHGIRACWNLSNEHHLPSVLSIRDGYLRLRFNTLPTTSQIFLIHIYLSLSADGLLTTIPQLG